MRLFEVFRCVPSVNELYIPQPRQSGWLVAMKITLGVNSCLFLLVILVLGRLIDLVFQRLGEGAWWRQVLRQGRRTVDQFINEFKQ